MVQDHLIPLSSFPPSISIRPVRPSDLESLLEFVNSAPDCLATVPRDKVRLEDKVDASVRSFFPRIKNPGSEHYLFVLEQSDTGRIAGISGLIGRVGGFDPFYTYEIRTEPWESIKPFRFCI